MVLSLDAVAEGLPSVLLVVGHVEALSVAGAAAIVDPEDRVAVIDEVLDRGAVSLAGLAARPSVHPDERRDLVPCGRQLRLVVNGGDHHSIRRLEADDFRVDEVRRIDLFRQ